MVSGLVVDVVAHGGVLGLADGERAIGALPAEGKGWREDVVDQMAGDALELADQVGDSQIRRQADDRDRRMVTCTNGVPLATSAERHVARRTTLGPRQARWLD